MSDHENRFLKKAFKNYQEESLLDKSFNLSVIRKIETSQYNYAILKKFLVIFLPVCLVFLSGLFLLYHFKGDAIIQGLIEILPFLKPWHIFLLIGLIYFHFVRSMLILAFIYFKKQFNFDSFYKAV